MLWRDASVCVCVCTIAVRVDVYYRMLLLLTTNTQTQPEQHQHDHNNNNNNDDSNNKVFKTTTKRVENTMVAFNEIYIDTTDDDESESDGDEGMDESEDDIEIDMNDQKLYLTELNLTRIPNKLFATPELQQLKELHLSWNNLVTLPPQFVHFFINLTTLDLSHNKLKQLPDDIQHLTNLKTAQFNYNQLN